MNTGKHTQWQTKVKTTNINETTIVILEGAIVITQLIPTKNENKGGRKEPEAVVEEGNKWMKT